MSDPLLAQNKDKWHNRLLIGTPTTGTVRMEWVNGRYGQTIPTNWSHVDVQQFMQPYLPIGYQVADAENLIAKHVVEHDFDWLLMYEHDNIPPPDAFIRLNEYMIKKEVPVVAGVYFTKSIPPEPLIYREKGMGYFADWKLGDKVWCTGVPFGFTLIHGSIIKALWRESTEYLCSGSVTRRVFNTPNASFVDWATGGFFANSGTSDLEWCARLIREGIFEKAGWPEIQKKKNPFLVDTGIFVKHIDPLGVMYPVTLPQPFLEGKITFKECIGTFRDNTKEIV